MARVLKMKSPAPARPRGRSSTTQSAGVVVEISVAEVATEAYARFEARAGGPGDALADWLEAERIVRARQLPAPRRPARGKPPRSSAS